MSTSGAQQLCCEAPEICRTLSRIDCALCEWTPDRAEPVVRLRRCNRKVRILPRRHPSISKIHGSSRQAQTKRLLARQSPSKTAVSGLAGKRKPHRNNVLRLLKPGAEPYPLGTIGSEARRLNLQSKQQLSAKYHLRLATLRINGCTQPIAPSGFLKVQPGRPRRSPRQQPGCAGHSCSLWLALRHFSASIVAASLPHHTCGPFEFSALPLRTRLPSHLRLTVLASPSDLSAKTDATCFETRRMHRWNSPRQTY